MGNCPVTKSLTANTAINNSLQRHGTCDQQISAQLPPNIFKSHSFPSLMKLQFPLNTSFDLFLSNFGMWGFSFGP